MMKRISMIKPVVMAPLREPSLYVQIVLSLTLKGRRKMTECKNMCKYCVNLVFNILNRF